MPGGSSAAKEEPAKAGSPPSLLRAVGSAEGSAGQDDHIIGPVMGLPTVSPAPAPVAEGVHPWEKYSLLVRIFTTQDRRSLEPHAWVEDLLKDFFQSILGINLSVILLSPTECLIFWGNCTQGQGMSWDESLRYTHQLMGIHPWTGYMIEVTAHQQTLKEARHKMQVVREFTHERTKQRIAHLNALAMVPVVKAQPTMPQRSPWGRGMTRQADRFFVQQQLREMNFDEPTFAQCPALLDAQPESTEREQFDSTREDVEEEEGGAKSALDAEINASTGEEMEASGHLAWVPSAEKRHWRNRAMQRERTWAHQEFQGPKNRCLSFPLFRETTKEDAISYRDWRSEIEDALEQGHDAAKFKEAMFASLERMARDNAKMINENGNLHVTRILDGLDSLYGVSMTFQSLNAALCGLQQKPMEPARAYYNCMAQITVILRECHGNRAPLDLLRALLEQEENNALTHTQYLPSTSARSTQPSKPAERYHQQPPPDKMNNGYTVHPAQLDAAPAEAAPEIDPLPLGDTMDTLELWNNNGFLIGLCQAIEISEHRQGHCFNCQKEGHRWSQYKETLSLELQELSDWQDREREERKKKALNPRRGVGMKGGHAPTPLVGISLVLPQASGTSAQ